MGGKVDQVRLCDEVLWLVCRGGYHPPAGGYGIRPYGKILRLVVGEDIILPRAHTQVRPYDVVLGLIVGDGASTSRRSFNE